jgi:parallel beta-helix repeat protein
MKSFCFQLTVAFLTLLGFEVSAATLYVSLNNTDPVPPYADWNSAATNIQDAVDASTHGDLILVTNGVYATSARVVHGALTNRVVIDKAVTLESVNGPALTIIKGYQDPAATYAGSTNSIRCLYLTNGAVAIGFTLTDGGTGPPQPPNGTTEEEGGGAWCESTNVVLSNCVLIANSAVMAGGGAYSGTLDNCIITSNSVTWPSSPYGGGGAYLSTLNDCILSGNQAIQSYGGGVAAGTVNNCTIAGNTAYLGGGAYAGILNNCILTNNFASNGGGGYYAYNGGTANDCILTGNSTSVNGGGADGGLLINCTVVGNAATNLGGGTYLGTAINSIIYYNTRRSPPISNGANDAGSYSTNCCTTPFPGGVGNITNEPLFVNLAGGDFHLQSNSPCINSGNNAYVSSATDLDGNPRIVGGTVDIGAYEYQTPTSIISYAWLDQYGLPTDGSADYADLDGTGFTVYQDWIAGLNPTNALSVLAMLPPAPTNNPAGLVVSWESVRASPISCKAAPIWVRNRRSLSFRATSSASWGRRLTRTPMRSAKARSSIASVSSNVRCAVEKTAVGRTGWRRRQECWLTSTQAGN